MSASTTEYLLLFFLLGRGHPFRRRFFNRSTDEAKSGRRECGTTEKKILIQTELAVLQDSKKQFGASLLRTVEQRLGVVFEGRFLLERNKTRVFPAMQRETFLERIGGRGHMDGVQIYPQAHGYVIYFGLDNSALLVSLLEGRVSQT